MRAHVHAIWLSGDRRRPGQLADGHPRGRGRRPDRSTSRDSFAIAIESARGSRARPKTRAQAVLGSVGQRAGGQSTGGAPGWLDRVLDSAAVPSSMSLRSLARACSAPRRRRSSDRRLRHHGREPRAEHKREAKRIRREAETQLSCSPPPAAPSSQSDFYVYRYLASEGFLPGYNFPRLPLSAYIPGARARRDSRDEFVQRPRFLAITEFGPRSIIYHEGSQYEVDSVILPVPRAGRGAELATASARSYVTSCGQLHEIEQGGGPDLCVRCGTILPAALEGLLAPAERQGPSPRADLL